MITTLVFASRSASTDDRTEQRQVSEKYFMQEGVSILLKLPWS